MTAGPSYADPNRITVAATARHSCKLILKDVVAQLPTLMLVSRGAKQIMRGPINLTFRTGDMVMIPSAKAFDLIGMPENGEFLATLLIPSRHLIDEIGTYHSDIPAIQTARAAGVMEPEFRQGFERAVEAASRPGPLPAPVIENRVREVLLWLTHKGLRFPTMARPDVLQKVRIIVSEDYAREWKAAEVAKSVGMSEATMRRRLEKQGTSFQQILIDIRMTRALALLQTTDLPIGQIAFEVGYESQSRFSARFRQRFNIMPSAIRNPLPDPAA